MPILSPASDYCMYLRKSRKDIEAEQQGAGETLARHRNTLTALAARRGLHIGRIYEEIVSADTISDRPVMQQLLAAVQAGTWTGVLVMEVERLARGDTIDQGVVAQAFKFSNTLIITPARDYDPDNEADEEFFEFGLFMSRREYKTTRRRLMTGRTLSAGEGKYMGSRPPFGYERYKLKGEKGWSLRVVPEKAELVRMVFDLYLHGRDVVDPQTGEVIHEDMGSQKIANVLNAMGSRTDMGKEWTADRLRKMMHEPSYIGKVQWYQNETKVFIKNGQRVKMRVPSDKHMVVDGRHEAIIDLATWDAVQALFASHQKSAVNTAREMKNPLNGLVKCSICGKAMVRTPMYGHLSGVDYVKCSTVRCATSASPLSGVEALIIDGLQDWVDQAAVDALPETPADGSAPTASGRESIIQHLADLQARRSRLMDFLEQGIYDAATYTERIALVNRDIASAQAALAALPERVPTTRERVTALLPKIKHVLQVYHQAPTNVMKNQLLHTVLSRVVYTKTHVCNRSEDPLDYLTVDLFPKMD